MRRPVKARLVLLAAAAARGPRRRRLWRRRRLGLGLGDPATLAPPKTPLFIEATVQPEGELKSNVESLAKSIGGIDDLGGLIVSETRKLSRRLRRRTRLRQGNRTLAGRKGRPLLPELRRQRLRQATASRSRPPTPAPAEDFIDKQVELERRSARRRLLRRRRLQGRKRRRHHDRRRRRLPRLRRRREDLQGDGRCLQRRIAGRRGELHGHRSPPRPSGSFADVFVDIGGLIEQSGGAIDPEARQFLDSAGIDPEEATAVASLIPGSDQVEIDLSTDLSGDNPPSGDASEAARLAPRRLLRRLRLGRLRRALRGSDRPASTPTASPARCRRTS